MIGTSSGVGGGVWRRLSIHSSPVNTGCAAIAPGYRSLRSRSPPTGYREFWRNNNARADQEPVGSVTRSRVAWPPSCANEWFLRSYRYPLPVEGPTALLHPLMAVSRGAAPKGARPLE